jgi:DoxX-like protein
MQPEHNASKGRLWAARIISGLPALFLILDGAAKLFKPAPVVEGTLRLGYSESVIVPIGIVLLVCTIVYLIPKTAVLGAILLTGYLGGAIATHVRVGDGLFPIFFAGGMGVLLWLGLYLRNPSLRVLVPINSI